MRRIAANRKKQTNIPEITLLDHFDHTNSINEVETIDKRYSSEIRTPQSSSTGKFGQSGIWPQRGLVKSYYTNDEAKLFSSYDEWSVDFWFRITTSNPCSLVIYANCDEEEIFEFSVQHQSNGYTNIVILDRRVFGYGAGYNSKIITSYFLHVLFDRVIIAGVPYMSVYLDGDRVDQRSYMTSESNKDINVISLFVNYNPNCYMDELCITPYSRAKGADRIAVPTEPYSLK